jgi:hypothetical protein
MSEHKVTEVDLTPTWSGILPAMLELYYQYRTGDNSSSVALQELKKMAALADKYVSLSKESAE